MPPSVQVPLQYNTTGIENTAVGENALRQNHGFSEHGYRMERPSEQYHWWQQCCAGL